MVLQISTTLGGPGSFGFFLWGESSLSKLEEKLFTALLSRARSCIRGNKYVVTFFYEPKFRFLIRYERRTSLRV